MNDLRIGPEMSGTSPSPFERKLIGETVTKCREWILAALVGLGIPGLGMASCAGYLVSTGGVHNYTEHERSVIEKRNSEIEYKRLEGEIPLSVYVECGFEKRVYRKSCRDGLANVVGIGYRSGVPKWIHDPSDYAWRVATYPPIMQRMKDQNECVQEAMPYLKFTTPEPPK